MTINRALLWIIAALFVCHAEAFSPSPPVSARKRLLLSSSRKPREQKTQLEGKMSRQMKSRQMKEALMPFLGYYPPWRGVWPAPNVLNNEILSMGAAHKSGWPKLNGKPKKTKDKVYAISLKDKLSVAQQELLHSHTTEVEMYEDGTPFSTQKLTFTAATEVGVTAYIESVKTTINGGGTTMLNLVGIQRKYKRLTAKGEEELMKMLKADAAPNGEKLFLKYLRDCSGNQDAKKLIIVSGMVTADLAATVKTKGGGGVDIKLFGNGGGFDFSSSTNLRSVSTNRILFNRYVGWNYKENKPLSGATLETLE